MKEPVIVHTDINDKVTLDNQFEYNVTTTIGLAEGGDFYLRINFLDLTLDDISVLAGLGNLPRRIPIKSELVNKEEYKISHIVVTKLTSNSNLTLTWECLSDDPSLYEGLTIK